MVLFAPFNICCKDYLSIYIYIQFNCSIPYTTNIEENVEIVHSIGIVLHQKSTIGAGTKIYQNVTIGNGSGPKIGKNCLIGSGAVILGNITIGDNVKIGANAVVLTDIPSDCTAVGVPAKIVKNRKFIMTNYHSSFKLEE